MLRTISAIAISIILSLSSCVDDETQKLNDSFDDIIHNEESIDKAFVDSILDGQSAGDPFRILSLKIENGKLFLTVEYTGGCADHDFSLIWNGDCDGFSNKSTEFAILHDANEDMCEALLTKELILDYSAIMEGQTAIEGCGSLTFYNASNAYSYYLRNEAEYLVQGHDCQYEVELEAAMCASGFLGDLWFKNADTAIQEDYDFFYFQPTNIAVDQIFEKGKYKIGVRLVESYEPVDGAICLAYPGPSLPAEILCIEKID